MRTESQRLRPTMGFKEGPVRADAEELLIGERAACARGSGWLLWSSSSLCLGRIVGDPLGNRRQGFWVTRRLGPKSS